MTIVFSGVSHRLIVVTVDGVETRMFDDGQREYESDVQKAQFYPGIGCVATWGERAGNQIFRFLRQQDISPETHSVEELQALVWRYLTEEYRPHEDNLGDVGYHVTGFDRSGQPRCYHIVWGWYRPSREEQVAPDYLKSYHHPYQDTYWLVYNGRNDLAQTVIHTLLKEIESRKDVRYDPSTLVGMVQLGDFVARFAAELTQEVGPPFLTYLISPNNQAELITNDDFKPVRPDIIEKKLRELEY